MKDDVMEHTRKPGPDDRQVLEIANNYPGSLVLAPVFFNGESRLALALAGQNEGGLFLRVLGVLVEPHDVLLDPNGNPPSFTPPQPKSAVN